MSIKEQIDKIPDSINVYLAEFQHVPSTDEQGNPCSMPINKGVYVPAANLKALAASHTALLEVLKEAVGGLDEYCADVWLKAQPIITEAEKL